MRYRAASRVRHPLARQAPEKGVIMTPTKTRACSAQSPQPWPESSYSPAAPEVEQAPQSPTSTPPASSTCSAVTRCACR